MNEILKLQAAKNMMTCKTCDLLEVLKFLKRVVPKTVIGKLYCCEITIKTNEVIFVAIGVTRILYCHAAGPAKVSIPFLYLYDIVKRIRTFSTEIVIGEGVITISKVTVNAKTFFFKDDTILRSVNLPINYSENDILRLPEKHTSEELAFNNLDDLIRVTKSKIEKEKPKIKNPIQEIVNQDQLKLNLL